MPYYPKDAKSYLYCWPGRDTGFNLAAMLLLGEDHFFFGVKKIDGDLLFFMIVFFV